MSIKAAQQVSDESLRAAVCIVGAGAAGITLACEFDGSGLAVILLEAGGFEEDPEHSHIYRRYYACHFENLFGRVVPHGAAVAFHFEKTRDGVYCRCKFQFTESAQREHRLVNTAFRLHFPNYSDARHGSAVMSGLYLAKSILIPEYRNIPQHNEGDAAAGTTLAHLRNVLVDFPHLVGFGYDFVFKRVLSWRKLPYTLVPNADGSYPLEFNCEQTPLASSRVTLTGESDRDGVPRVHVDWRVCDEDIESACRGFMLLRDAMQRLPRCRLEFDEERLRDRMRRSVPLGGHHIGTTRMAASSQQGVVDGDCALFELPNLYVASSAVFPTSGHANPTLTIVALAVRLAAHLRSRLQPATA